MTHKHVGAIAQFHFKIRNPFTGFLTDVEYVIANGTVII
ncbi:Uncharacterised protein [Vibrio cholerae]|nr:Uncharacterised protein [Vibrio cholerae]